MGVQLPGIYTPESPDYSGLTNAISGGFSSYKAASEKKRDEEKKSRKFKELAAFLQGGVMPEDGNENIADYQMKRGIYQAQQKEEDLQYQSRKDAEKEAERVKTQELYDSLYPPPPPTSQADPPPKDLGGLLGGSGGQPVPQAGGGGIQPPPVAVQPSRPVLPTHLQGNPEAVKRFIEEQRLEQRETRQDDKLRAATDLQEQRITDAEERQRASQQRGFDQQEKERIKREEFQTKQQQDRLAVKVSMRTNRYTDRIASLNTALAALKKIKETSEANPGWIGPIDKTMQNFAGKYSPLSGILQSGSKGQGEFGADVKNFGNIVKGLFDKGHVGIQMYNQLGEGRLNLGEDSEKTFAGKINSIGMMLENQLQGFATEEQASKEQDAADGYTPPPPQTPPQRQPIGATPAAKGGKKRTPEEWNLFLNEGGK